jgi:hypothetical protein
MFNTYDIKPYLEVDYFSLSTVVVYDPYLVEYETTNNINRPKGLVENLYN